MSGWSQKVKRSAVVILLLLPAAMYAVPFGAACSGIWQETRRPDPFTLALPRVGGGTVRLSLYRGQVLLVDFFTTWSQASLLAIPSYIVLHEKYRERGVSFIGVAMDDLGEAVAEPFVTGLEIPYPVAVATESVRKGNLHKIIVGRVPMKDVEKVVLELL